MEIPKYFYFRVRTINKGTGLEMEDASDVDVVEVMLSKLQTSNLNIKDM